ncbi:hypothetical protein [Thiohalobacter thiocyanaticus]|uniref:Uncharacterized protein n=1 Tax=Thiohalobacter thiocyanaticus TaxID=585455 RepID=A0A426QH85_9GAMM|nr:hypothetical protein [Thiohalobacter thiocyanaticus]RRQ21112.1 hypothetical protein D6C00_03480 [Thiohalobacter thiocyanaticus]
MNTTNQNHPTKKYGIRGRLPEGDPMALPHLLGEDWHWEHWYATKAERDAVFEEMQAHFDYYRSGDWPSQVLEKVERNNNS